ncbi:MAG: hypothetical protein HC851_14385 [Acaryochloris sp. RU_4_1]|nr:hypothetical protein [Acaryochloris sp. SU_5_25]NJM66756.1 hypothetical protein [Acaryochloris sp. RU_4_1]NJR55631.1 hypothetical protein [Acaryochloris sp. CRU_2_0]
MTSHPFQCFRHGIQCFCHGRRLRQTLEILAEHPTETIPQLSASASNSQNIYRFWANKRVNPDEILASHRASVLARVNQQAVVLAIQDTTDLDFTSLNSNAPLNWSAIPNALLAVRL